MEQWISIIVSILSGLAVCIPLVIKLVEAVKSTIQEKNWKLIVEKTLELMVDAEQIYLLGSDKKEYVVEKINEYAKEVNYELDETVVSNMIDGICDATKLINVEEKEEAVE